MILQETESKKTVRTFGIASFLNDFGSDIIYPIWPLFVTSVLGANMAMLGLIDGLGDAVVSLSQAFAGYYSDKLQKRKIFVWLGYLFGATSRIGYAFTASWQMLLPFRVLDRAGKIRSAPRDAIVADVSDETNRGRNFGFLRSMDNLGAVLGIVFCLLFIDIGYTNLFLLAAVPSVVGSLLIIKVIKETPAQRATVFKGLSFKHLDTNFRLFLFLSALFSLGSFSYSFLLLYAFDAGFEQGGLPVLYLIFTVVAAIFSLPFGKLSDRIGRKNVLMMSFCFWAVCCLGLLFLKNYWGIIGCFILYGLHKAAIEPVQKTLVSELAPPELRASTLGGFQMVLGVCAFPSSLLAGLLWQHVDSSAPLVVAFSLTIISLCLLFFISERKTKH
ncbi:MAG: MFS transporter [Ignavibacteriae bacterium]|nr:MFS transporter [Ignavibacteriota bacterium]